MRHTPPAFGLGTVMLFAVLTALALTGCGGDAGASPTVDPNAVAPPNAVVQRVVDGDTITVRVGGAIHTARLIGIDTPETVDPRRPVGCFGPEASARTNELLPPGTAVHLQLDAEARDMYGRLLVYAVRSTDGLFVNLDLARNGFAEALSIKPNTAHAGAFSAAVAAARAEGAGLWGGCAPP